jgi:hypothetical protein
LESSREREYFAKNIAITKPPGDHIFEFLIEGRDEIGALESILRAFSKHKINIRTISAGPGQQVEGKRGNLFVTSAFCDFSKADCTIELLLGELRNLPFVRNALSADMTGRLFDRFLFPMKIMGEHRVILFRVEPLLNIEKHLVERMGSGGAAMMFEEGRSYAEEVIAQYKKALPDLEAEALLDSIKDGLRATGWGIFSFRRASEGFEVTVTDPPLIEGSEYKENRFFYGVTARILESLYGGELVLSGSNLDLKNRKLVFRLRRK